MNSFLGIVATVDEYGNVKIPLDKLETAGIKINSQVEIFSNTECVFIRTAEIFCDICGGNGNAKTVGNLKMCKSCIEQLKNQVDEEI
jgi:bifunctional DNA-binding transcriptional regulator/antitoxin component of YhaV-PrlF toxin-antitoxin module